MPEYVGVIHVHTTHSDGDDTPHQAIAAAMDAGLDFLVISDHSSDAVRRQGLVGRHGRLLCISAPEIGTKGDPHFLTFGASHVDHLDALPATEALSAAMDAGGRNFIAHPHSAHIAIKKCKPVDWVDWETKNFCGLEIWSYLHDICHYTVPWAAPLLFWAPAWLVRGPRRETLKIWDQLTQQRPVAAIAALDNHARRLVLGTIVPHRHAFRALRTHILCDQLPDVAAEAEKVIINALCDGSAWAAMDQWADSRGFKFEVSDNNGRCTTMGRRTTWADGMTLHLKSPKKADLTVIHNGATLEMRRHSDGFDLPIRQSGVYRVEAYLGRRPWVLTNPIYLTANDE